MLSCPRPDGSSSVVERPGVGPVTKALDAFTSEDEELRDLFFKQYVEAHKSLLGYRRAAVSDEQEAVDFRKKCRGLIETLAPESSELIRGIWGVEKESEE